MKVYKVRDFMLFTPNEILNNVKGTIPVLFEDGVVVMMKDSELVFNRYVWDLVFLSDKMANYINNQGHHDKVKIIFKIKSDYNIVIYYKNGYFTGKSLLKLFSVIYKDMIEVVLKGNLSLAHHNMEEFFKGVYDVVSNLYNDLSSEVNHYAITFNILNLLEVQLNKELMTAMEKVSREESRESIKEAYNVLDKIIRDENNFNNNPIKLAYISGSINENQMKQILGPMGFVTDIDSKIYKKPITTSITLGLNTIYQSAIESRSAAKALYFSSKHIKDSEYLARKLQLLTMVVRSVVMGDCGTKRTVLWHVREDDIKNMIGIYYVDESGEEKPITINDTHLAGKTIRIRNSLMCELPNKEHVCSKCFGDMAFNIPKHVNIGHYSSTIMSRSVTQGLLGTKHLTASAGSSTVVLDKIGSKYFTIKNNNGYALKPEYMRKGNGIKIVIDIKECYGLKDIRTKESVDSVSPDRVTHINKLTIIHGDEVVTVTVDDQTKYGVLTHRMLQYIVQHGLVMDDRNNYIIDMSSWRSKTPFMEIPEIEYNFDSYRRDLEKLLTDKKLDSLSHTTSPEGFLSKFFDKVNSRLNINMSFLSIIAYGLSVYSKENRNFDLSRGSSKPGTGSLVNGISNRSGSAIYAHESLLKNITSSTMFYSNNKPDHILDVLLAPNEVLGRKSNT